MSTSRLYHTFIYWPWHPAIRCQHQGFTTCPYTDHGTLLLDVNIKALPHVYILTMAPCYWISTSRLYHMFIYWPWHPAIGCQHQGFTTCSYTDHGTLLLDVNIKALTHVHILTMPPCYWMSTSRLYHMFIYWPWHPAIGCQHQDFTTCSYTDHGTLLLDVNIKALPHVHILTMAPCYWMSPSKLYHMFIYWPWHPAIGCQHQGFSTCSYTDHGTLLLDVYIKQHPWGEMYRQYDTCLIKSTQVPILLRLDIMPPDHPAIKECRCCHGNASTMM